MKDLVFAFFTRKNGNVLTRIKILMYKMAHTKTKQTKKLQNCVEMSDFLSCRDEENQVG